MFKLIYFKAVNVIGFMSGLNKKTFKLDLEDLQDKDIIVILGNNATGKSTFQSLIHPMHTPSDGRTKFIIPNKEGELVRIYRDEDGTEIITKCIFHPKSDGGHTPKCFFSIKKPGEKHDIEMNENGNVSSYTSLIYTYFGITKDYVNFASYSDAVNSIVTMTDTERKNSVATLIPNTGRFELAYTTINEKYKELRNLIRNVSQKIMSIRDEDSLTADVIRITKELTQAMVDKDEYTRKFAKAEGRVKELSHGQDMKTLQREYYMSKENMITYYKRLQDLGNYTNRILDMFARDPVDDILSIDMSEVERNIIKYEKRLARLSANTSNILSRMDSLRSEMYRLEKDLSENESVLMSLDTQDIEELKEAKKKYKKDLDDMQYSKHVDTYQDMNYDEIVTFSKTVAMLNTMIQSLYDEFGQVVTVVFDDLDGTMSTARKEFEELKITVATKTSKKDSLYRSLIEKEQYQKLLDTLDKRPKECTINTCPFIATALKYQHVAGEIVELKNELKQLNLSLEQDESYKGNLERELELRDTVKSMMAYIESNRSLLKRYLNTTPEELYHAIARATWNQYLDVTKLKSLAVILSEKDYYIKITTQLIPQLDHSIEMAKLYGSNRDMLLLQRDRIKQSIKVIKKELKTLEASEKIYTDTTSSYTTKLKYWRKIKEYLDEYHEIYRKASDAEKVVNERSKEIELIQEIVEKCRKYDNRIRECVDTIEELTPIKQKMELDLNMLFELKDEKIRIERDFLIVEVMKMILQPGKGLRKELLNLYMHEIFTTANQLLLNTFDGQLRLLPFIITDKEFTIPYEYSGSIGNDIAYASSSQKSTISMALSLAIISQLIGKYSIMALDEADQSLSSENKAQFVDIIAKQMKYIGIHQAFIITHSPDYYLGHNVGAILFPGSKINKKELDCIEV